MLLNNQLQLRSYLFWAVILGLIVMGALLVLPFLIALLSAYLLAYMVRPLFLKLEPRVHTKIAALACCLVIMTLVILPVGLVVIGVANQAGSSISELNITQYIAGIAAHPFLVGFHLDPDAIQAELVQIITSAVESILTSLPETGLGLFITILGVYYILSNWEKITIQLKKHIPSENKEKLIQELDKTTQAILYGTLVIAVLEFIVAYIGFTLSGVEASLILATIIFVLAFVPSVGTPMVWIPVSLYYFSTQQYPIALGVFISGLILTIGIETVLYAKWIGEHTRIHPFIMLIGVIGGINFFGIFGFVFGPLILVSSLDIIKGAMLPDEKPVETTSKKKTK